VAIQELSWARDRGSRAVQVEGPEGSAGRKSKVSRIGFALAIAYLSRTSYVPERLVACAFDRAIPLINPEVCCSKRDSEPHPPHY